MARYWAHCESNTSRLVIDEAHQVLSQSQFRHAFEKIKQLAAVAIPHIFLTATLPIRMEQEFLLEVGMPQSTQIIRAPTSRPNISYNLVRFNSNVTATFRLIRDLTKLMEQSFMSPGQIGIIFAQEISDVEQIAEALQCSRSHSRMNATERAQDYNAWISGQVRWMVSTTTLTHGIDLPNI
ncbi:P-loop containing nucleoside triphosphate hydrolase protein, partial [Armillaria novae-zelandiae]